MCWIADTSGAQVAEYLIHTEDIRRPLGRRGAIPGEHLVAALDGVSKLPGARVTAKAALAKNRWEATDVAWSAGHGTIRRAPGIEALMAGRDLAASG
jgi:hypothetical protein